ncbi:MAG: creatininase family protein [Alphaproteobacteria bacterium]|nr:MAG: creatininase family protein [Alphaproteobacteria bacterium]
MLLHHCTWPEVEAHLKRSTGIIVPIGSTEQHGPNGLLGTDALCAEVVARGVGEAVDALVAPCVAVGMAQHHLGFPGTMTLRPATLIAVVRDMVLSLARHGFERFYFVNGHGGNIATVTAAFSEVYADLSLARDGRAQRGVRCRLKNWWDGPAIKALSGELFGAAEGSHATPSEVSLTQFAFPETIKRAAMTPDIAPKGPIYDALDYRRRFADGRIGSNPALASPEAGKRLYEAAVAEVAEDYRQFLAED